METPVPPVYPTNNSTEDRFMYIETYLFIIYVIPYLNITCFSITFILGTIGNGLVIWIAGFKMKTVSAVWFLNLAVADFIFNIFLPFEITKYYMRHHWPFGQILCKVSITILFLNMLSSVSFLTVISIDRCVSILWPFWAKIHRTPRLASTIAVFIWVFSLIISAPNLAFYNVHNYYNNYSRCYLDYAVPPSDDRTIDYNKLNKWNVRNQAMIITRFVSMFVIPFTIILVCYGFIVFKINRIKRPTRSRRPFKVISAIVVCFFCCWFPYHICPIILSLNNTYFFVSMAPVSICTCLAYSNSCLNPILYVFLGKDFKDHFRKSIPAMLENAFNERYDQGCKEGDDDADTKVELDTSC
ncbi:N-formyl peptide receptor 3-like [Ascaphus truei]|uniref:N-formyl peptide receptor 3-like n=1 Tax=Ascaphus truei TaxID=8439 RepID=UPI003F590C56